MLIAIFLCHRDVDILLHIEGKSCVWVQTIFVQDGIGRWANCGNPTALREVGNCFSHTSWSMYFAIISFNLLHQQPSDLFSSKRWAEHSWENLNQFGFYFDPWSNAILPGWPLMKVVAIPEAPCALNTIFNKLMPMNHMATFQATCIPVWW